MTHGNMTRAVHGDPRAQAKLASGTKLRTLIAGNWKMHGLQAQLAEIAAMARCPREMPHDVDVVVCVPATLITGAVHAASRLIEIGGEDCSAEQAGAFTGEIDAEMLRDAGATNVILGHSERRRRHHETNAIVAAKVKAAWQQGLKTIVCIGENAAQRREGNALRVCGEQLAQSLPDLPPAAQTAIAYEPLWAIGSGATPTRDEIVEVTSYLRAALEKRFGEAGRAIRIIYGGSVMPDNARSILRMPCVDGVLIGGASLVAADFNAIVDAACGHFA
jgi:triosephosphate isomerase (TIM)